MVMPYIDLQINLNASFLNKLSTVRFSNCGSLEHRAFYGFKHAIENGNIQD